VLTERDELIALLGRAAAADPADDWTATQRVRYLGEAKRPDEALAAARPAAARRGGARRSAAPPRTSAAAMRPPRPRSTAH
jgi:hypothetical protein